LTGSESYPTGVETTSKTQQSMIEEKIIFWEEISLLLPTA
jgi:hypothetical protein